MNGKVNTRDSATLDKDQDGPILGLVQISMVVRCACLCGSRCSDFV